MKAYKQVGSTVFVKHYFLSSHLDMFSPNIGDACEDHGEQFPIDITPLENCYNGRLASFSLPDYGWSLRREMDIQKKHQSRHQRYFLKK